MEEIRRPEMGAGLVIFLIIQLVISGLGLMLSIKNLVMKKSIDAELIADGFPITPTSDIIIGLVFLIILIIGVILILKKKELGIYIYFTDVVSQIVYVIVFVGFSPFIFINFIMPFIMGIFIWRKKRAFSVEAKA